MLLKFIFIFKVLITVPLDATVVNYCSSNVCANTKEHTLCRFPSPGPGPNCYEYQKTIITDEDKNALLNKINSRRNKIASGEVRSFPPAENMIQLGWNEDLEVSAQRWADQCISQDALEVKDKCRDLVNVGVGQNIASVYGEAPGLSPLSLVDVWYMELLNCNSSVLPRYLPSSERGFPHYDYFTQLVWARSSEVGCGGVKFQELIKYTQEKKYRTVHRLVCNFAPSGNVLKESVYLEGPPCSRCPDEGKCDQEHSALCSAQHMGTKNKTTKTATENSKNLLILSSDIVNENISAISETKIETESINDENITVFDYFSQLYQLTRQPVTIATTLTSSSCKDVLAVDEFVELLKKKLSSDSMFKELLLSTKNLSQNGNGDSNFSDANVAAFVSRIYSKKAPTTTTKLPENEFVNSTLLVDLVEAVIFRSADKPHGTEETIETLQPSSVGPIKIQAELGQVKLNQDFTGHYFFPEDVTEETVMETTDTYYDTSNLPVSDVISEIENIKRDRTTQDFLDEIIESDSGNDETRQYKRSKRSGDIKYLEKLYQLDSNNNIPRHVRQVKILGYSCDYEDQNIAYNDLLRRIAADLKLLRLNERFHCSINGANAKILFTYEVYLFFYLIY